MLGNEALASPEIYEAKASFPKSTALPAGQGIKASIVNTTLTESSIFLNYAL